MRIDLIGGSYEQKYKSFNSQRTINMYPVPSIPEEKNKTQIALFPTAGSIKFATISGRYNRGIFTVRNHDYANRCFSIVDDGLYEIANDGTVTSRGTLTDIGTGSTKVWMVANANNQLGIFHYNASYVFNLASNTLTKITSAQFPGLVTSAAFTDGYTFVTSVGAVYFCTTNDMLNNWSSLNVYSPTSTPAPTIAVTTFKEQTVNFTSIDITTYYNDGATPWTRLPRSTILVGLVNPESLATWNDGMMFLGKNSSGETAVYFYDSQTCAPISPFSINWQLNNVNNLYDAYSYIEHTKDGHLWYYLTIPETKTTYIYDVTTKMWHERQSTQPALDSNGDFVYRQFRGRHYTNFNGKNLFSDLYSGNIYKEDYNTFTEDSNVIIRTRISSTIEQEKNNISVTEVEFDMNSGSGALSGQGSDPLLMFQYSKDNGYTFSPIRTIPIGPLGYRTERPRIRKLGTARQWTVKFSISDPVDFMINGALAHGIIGTS